MPNVEAAALPKRVSCGSLDVKLKAGRLNMRIHINVADRQMDEGIEG